jgi:PilZ domain
LAENRRYERIDIELPCRLYIPGDDGLRFQAFTTTQNLGLGGVYISSSFLLKEGLELMAELTLPSGPLAVRARISHAVPFDHRAYHSGMGLEFLGVDARGRETLLRYFTPERYHEFHALFTSQFPHLKKELPLSDVSLLLNLWEEWKSSTAAPEPEAPRRGRR